MINSNFVNKSIFFTTIMSVLLESQNYGQISIIIEIQQVVSQNYIRDLIFSMKLVLTTFKVTSGQIYLERLKKGEI